MSKVGLPVTSLVEANRSARIQSLLQQSKAMRAIISRVLKDMSLRLSGERLSTIRGASYEVIDQTQILRREPTDEDLERIEKSFEELEQFAKELDRTYPNKIWNTTNHPHISRCNVS